MKRRISVLQAGLLVGVSVGSAALAFVPSDAAAAERGAIPCVRTTVAAKRSPAGPAQYESGQLRLSNGASLRLQGTPAELRRVGVIAIGDPVAACYGPLKSYADAGPSRTITVLDLANGQYFATLIGTWR